MGGGSRQNADVSYKQLNFYPEWIYSIGMNNKCMALNNEQPIPQSIFT